jgi:hypothetical protein
MRIVLLFAFVALAGCGDHVGNAAAARAVTPSVRSTAVTPIPWTSAPPVLPTYAPPTVRPMPLGVPRCDPRALRADAGVFQGAMGAIVGSVYLVNDNAPCVVSGSFALRFLDARGLVLIEAAVGDASGGPGFPGWALAGRARIQWDAFWCDAERPATAVEITYEGVVSRARFDRPMWGGDACDGYPADARTLPASRGGLSAWPITEEITPPPTPAPPALVPTLAAPARVRAGQILRYVVTLTNTSGHVVDFDPCPWYSEWLVGGPLPTDPPPSGLPAYKAAHYVGTPRYAGQSKAAFSLNCSAVSRLDAGASVELAMEIVAPADGAGEGTLRWEIAEPLSKQASARVTIDPR